MSRSAAIAPKRRRARRLSRPRRFARTVLRAARSFARTLGRAHPSVRFFAVAALVLAVLAAVNWTVQATRKPSEVFFPLSGVLAKTPSETWRHYAALFRGRSTPVITAELLAALAQVEGAGNPVARTYWRWRLTSNPLELYQPASSAVGMYQITDATFRDAKRYCIHNHVLVEDGPWYDLGSCWFNSLYTRVFPGDAIEMTAAYLDRSVSLALARQHAGGAALAQRQELAAVIHLCGAAAGEIFARRDFRPAPGQKCGEHDLRAYLAQVDAMKQRFARLAATD